MQLYGVRVRLNMEAVFDEDWDWSTDWDKPTSATLGQMICNMDNVKNGLYNTGYYLIANFEGEAFSGYAGKPLSKLEVLLQEGPEYNPKFTTQGWEPKTRV